MLGPLPCPRCGAHLRNVAPAWSLGLSIWHRLVLPQFQCPSCGRRCDPSWLDEPYQRRVLISRVASAVALVVTNGAVVVWVFMKLLTAAH